jgi:hypothetical protein
MKDIQFKTVKIMQIYGFLPKEFKVITSMPNMWQISNDKTIPSFFYKLACVSQQFKLLELK